MDELRVGDLRIAFKCSSTGPPLVLLHGALSDSRTWRKQLDGLSNDFTVVAWDAPGCGRSSDPPETFNLSDYADCLGAFIDLMYSVCLSDRDKLAEQRGWDPETAGYVWMVEQLDRDVGTILDCLREYGLEKNTVVFVTSDHGGINYGKRIFR